MKTLVPVLETFVGIRVRVELRDGIEVIGILDEVSFPFMNLVLLDVVVHDFEDVFEPPEPLPTSATEIADMTTTGADLSAPAPLVVLRQRRRLKKRTMDRIFVAGHRIQYVHFPDRVTMARQLAIADKRIAQATNIYSRGVRPDKKPRGFPLAAMQ